MFSIPPANIPATVNMIASVVKFPVMFIPLDELPSSGQASTFASSLTYFPDIARYCIHGHGYLNAAIDPLVLLAFVIMFITIAVMLHTRTMPRRI